MPEQAIDYPIALAELAYSRSLIPNKAARENAAFDNKVQEVRERLTSSPLPRCKRICWPLI
jgi:hypothetical protein